MEQKRISRMERILDLVRGYTGRTAEGDFVDFTGLTASDLAAETGLDRANVSKELNRLYHQGLVVKCQGKPTIFLHQAVLTARFPGVFIPSTIPCGESLTEFLMGLASCRAVQPGRPDCLEAVIGSKGSMKKAVLQAKAAISYPPWGIHTLILGSAGIGKQRFAHTIFEYAQARGLSAPDGKFVVFNCQDYSGSPQLLMAQIFGYGKNYLPGADKGRHGLIEQARGGIFCLDGVHKLSPKVQDLLITLIEKNTFNRMGESSITRQGELMIVATSTEPAGSPSIQRFVRNMPILIRLPDLSERSPRELLEHLVMFFGRESERIRLPFCIHKDVLSCMVQAPYPGQIGEVKGCVKGICSMAYLEHITGISPSSDMEISYRHLPLSITEAAAPGSEKALLTRELFDRFRDDYVQFSPDGPAGLTIEEEGSSMDPKVEPELPSSREQLQISDVGSYISRCMDRIRNGCSSTPGQVRACFPAGICRTVESVLDSSPPYAGILQNPRLFYGFMLHLYNALRRQKENIPPSFTSPAPSDIRRTNPREYETALKLREALNRSEQICLPDWELSFISMYLYLAINWTSDSHVHFLVIFHGEGVSQGISGYLNSAVKRQLAWGVDCGPDTSLEEVLRQAESLARSADQGAGILIFGDTEPFTGLHTHISRVTGIRTETIGDASMALMLRLVKRAAEENCSLLALMSEAPDAHAPREVYSADGIATSFLNRIIHEILAPSLTFLNPGKAVDTLLTVLSRILSSLSMEYSDEIALKFIFHCAHMMERVIKGEPLKYPHLKNFINQNNRLMAEVERQLGYAQEVFGVPIPAAEIAYAAEIFLPFAEETGAF